MIWSIIKYFFIWSFAVWLLWLIGSVIAVRLLGYTGATNGALFWCVLLGCIGAWRGRVKYTQKQQLTD